MQIDPFEIYSLGDQAVTFSIGDAIHPENHRKILAMRHWLEQQALPGVLDLSVAYHSVTIVYDVFTLQQHQQTESCFDFIRDMLLKAYHESETYATAPSATKRIPVCYEGDFAPDMEFAMAQKNLSRDEVIALHTGRTYLVYMIGFLPGFPYMGEVDPRITLPRKTTPRRKTEAGSVGIAGVQTGIYPIASPGGWQIIGRTPVRMFNRDMNPPVTLGPGDEVQFYEITSDEFRKMNEHAA